MMRLTRYIASVAVIAVAAAIAVAAIAPAIAPAHRLHRASPPLPTSLTVDEQEWSIIPSERVLAAGIVHFTIYNRGQDEHDLVIQGPGGKKGPVYVMPGQSATIADHLYRGTYKLYCSMYMGTPQSHYAMGMHTLITVR